VAAGALRPEYPACRTPLRGVDPARTAELLAWLARADGAAAPSVQALQAAVVERFRRDRLAYSDVLEGSFTCDDRDARLHRFSYAFPGFRADPAGVASAIGRFCRPFGRAAEEACVTVIRAAKSKAVAQLLFGFASDGGGRSRVELHLQFHGWEAPAALVVAGQMLGVPLGDRLGVFGPLHQLCLDVGPRGLVAAKLYSVIERLRLDDVAVRVGPVPLADALRELGVTELQNVRAIHRLRGPGEAGILRPSEIAFSLQDNDLRWADVRRLPPVRALLDRHPAIGELEASFRLAVQRVSGSVAGDRGRAKLTVYHVLTEVEPGV
jgi:hypothetical protein